MATQQQRGAAFKALHEQPGTFVIPNPWNEGTARMLASLGYRALATTSAGFAFSIGRPDDIGNVSRDEHLAHARAIVEATNLPVSADLQNGFGDPPETCAETTRLAAAAGLVGCSIEDATGLADKPIYPFEAAVERIRAAATAARALPFPFVLTARAENYLYGRADLADTIGRLQAFAEAGADVLYPSGLKSAADIAAVVKAVAPKPVNVVVGLSGMDLTLADLAATGVKRISIGSSMARAAYGAFLRAAREVAERGTFTFARDAVPFGEISEILDRQP